MSRNSKYYNIYICDPFIPNIKKITYNNKEYIVKTIYNIDQVLGININKIFIDNESFNDINLMNLLKDCLARQYSRTVRYKLIIL